VPLRVNRADLPQQPAVEQLGSRLVADAVVPLMPDGADEPLLACAAGELLALKCIASPASASGKEGRRTTEARGGAAAAQTFK